MLTCQVAALAAFISSSFRWPAPIATDRFEGASWLTRGDHFAIAVLRPVIRFYEVETTPHHSAHQPRRFNLAYMVTLRQDTTIASAGHTLVRHQKQSAGNTHRDVER